MIKLIRHAEVKTCTPGTLTIGDHSWPTLELPYRGNKPFESCVPPGEYQLVPYDSGKYGDVYVAVNHHLNVYHSMNDPDRPPTGRYKCLYFHRGNSAHNFEGCGGVGKEWLPAKEMITRTDATCKLVNNLIRLEGSLTMVIENGQ